MKKSCAPWFISLALAASSPAAETSWSGNFTEKKYLNGQAVFQLNILQEGAQISVDFDGAYNDGHGCAPQASGPGQVVDAKTLKFTFTDSENNAGTGTIKRVGNEVIMTIKPNRIVDRKCLAFYEGIIRLKPAH